MKDMREKITSNEALLGVNAIEVLATEWVARLDRCEPDSRESAELEQWLAQDARHAGAFLRAQAMWKSLDRVQILHRPGGDSVPLAWYQTVSRRAMLRNAAIAGGAGLAAAAAAGIAFLRTGQNQIATPVGEIRRVPLLDGSLAAVNTDSELIIDFKSDLREVTLQKGEVWFDVAKDRKRPFVVTTGDVRVRAVGTAFSVRKREDGADVLVTEGVVETWSAGGESEKRLVMAGSRVFVSDIAGPSGVVPASAQIDRTLAWREGEIALDGETLTDAAAEFNRYNERKLTVDPSLTNERLVGWFHTNEPDTFARAAATVLKLKVTETAEEIHLAPDFVQGQ